MTKVFLLTISNQFSTKPNFEIVGIRNFMYTKHNEDNAKLRIFSFIPQLQRIQPNFMNYTYQTTKQTNTTRTTKTTTSTWVSPLTQSLCSYNWDNANSVEYSYSNLTINQPVSYISSITNLCTLSIPKNLYVAWWTISYISSIPTWIRYRKLKIKNWKGKHLCQSLVLSCNFIKKETLTQGFFC